MIQAIERPHAQRWMNQIFSAKAARTGGVVRRSVKWVDREIGCDAFEAKVRDLGFHMIECGGQFVVICNPHGLRIIC